MSGKQKRPPGPMYRMTPEWKAAVEEELARLGKKRAWLAQEAGVTPASITNMLKPDARQSRVVPQVCAVLGLALSMYEDERDAESHRLLRQLREQDPREFDRVIERISRGLKPGAGEEPN